MNQRTPSTGTLSLAFFGLLLLGITAHGCASETPTPPDTTQGPCTSNADCDASKGFACIDGACLVRCDSHFDCAPVGLCESRADSTYCVPGTSAKPGQYYQRCPNGSADCDQDADFFCIGSGAGDFEAYCTADCGGDADCPAGFRCGVLGATPCETACGEAGQATPDCAPAAEIGQGLRYDCHPVLGLVRKACLQSNFCSPCERDEDCLALPNQICARDASGQKICTQACDPGFVSCPWGNASECGIWDERGIYTCSHRFGACRGQGNGCEPCVDVDDCPTGYCSRSAFSGEQFCVDLSVSCDCGSDADASDICSGHGCPDSPGGIPMTCYSGSRFTGDPLTDKCISAASTDGITSSPRTGCWPPP